MPFSRSKKAETNLESPVVSSPETAKEKIPIPFKNIVDSVSKKVGSALRGAESGSALPDSVPRKKSKQNVWDVLIAQDNFISGVMEAQMSCGSKGKKDSTK